MTRSRGRRSVFLLSIFAALVAGCSHLVPVGASGGAGLLRNLLRARSIEVVIASDDVGEVCSAAAARIARVHGVPCRVVGAAEPGDAEAPRIVVLGPGDRPAADSTGLLARLGIQVVRGASRPSFAYGRSVFAGAFDALVAVFEDPDRPGLPITVLYANEPEQRARFARRIDAGWKPWIRVYRAGALALEGPLAADGSADARTLVDREAARKRAIAGYEPFVQRVPAPSEWPGLHVSAAPGIDPARRDAYLAAVDRARREIARWAGPSKEDAKLELVLHARPEILAACCVDPGLAAAVLEQRRVHALIAPGIPDDAGAAAARVLAEEELGIAAESWIADGASLLAAGAWWGRDLEEWIAWLRLAGLAPGIDAIVDGEATRTNSPHVVRPLRAALFRFVLESRGEAFARGLWKGTAEFSVKADTEKAFFLWLDELAARHRSAIEARRAGRKTHWADGFLAGVGIEEPGGSPARGFGSAGFEASLAEARAIGANTATLSCFVAAERDPEPIAEFESVEEGLQPFETDLRVFAGLSQIRASGMRAMLEPHLLTGPAGTLAGTGPQGGERGWQRFFDGYGRFAIHAGLLAELAGADGLVLGGGMLAATSRAVDDQPATVLNAKWRHDGWLRVVRSARAAFAGTLTWGAESVAEAQLFTFWSEFDAVGCDLAPVLEGNEKLPSDARPGLIAGRRIELQIAELEELAKKVGKPLLLTRVGFHSGSPRPGWPREGRPGQDVGMQALEFEALAPKLKEARARGVTRGVVLWRWSSDPSDRGVEGRDPLLRPGPAREAAAKAIAGL